MHFQVSLGILILTYSTASHKYFNIFHCFKLLPMSQSTESWSKNLVGDLREKKTFPCSKREENEGKSSSIFLLSKKLEFFELLRFFYTFLWFCLSHKLLYWVNESLFSNIVTTQVIDLQKEPRFLCIISDDSKNETIGKYGSENSHVRKSDENLFLAELFSPLVRCQKFTCSKIYKLEKQQTMNNVIISRVEKLKFCISMLASQINFDNFQFSNGQHFSHLSSISSSRICSSETGPLSLLADTVVTWFNILGSLKSTDSIVNMFDYWFTIFFC